METMAAQVAVPPEDLEQSRAFPGFEPDRAVPGVVRLISIHSGPSSSPGAFVSVKYPNTWFWIDDNDLASKHVFSLIMMLFAMVDTGCKPKLDFLDNCKAIAKRAKLKAEDFWLHKFRATFATRHLRNREDLRTVQSWLGHKDMQSTMRYLKPNRSQAVRDRVDTAWA
jgi:hypothetical protein